MARMTSQQFAAKWNRRLKGATEDIRNGVTAVTEAPTAKAAAKADKMLNNLRQSIETGRWQNALKRVSVEDWKQATLNKGVPRISAGADGAVNKVTDFADQLLPAIDKAKGTINNMPDITLQDNIARMTRYVEEMAKFKKS